MKRGVWKSLLIDCVLLLVLVALAMVSAEMVWGERVPLPEPGTAGAPADVRYCGEPARDKRGKILRSQEAKDYFASVYPHPNDGQDWYIDHVIPLSNGGCDLPFNMQWLPANLKTCKGICKDRFERKVYNPQRKHGESINDY